MNFMDTVAGQTFATHTVPALKKEVKELKEVIHNLSEQIYQTNKLLIALINKTEDGDDDILPFN